MKTKRIWVLIATGARARILRNLTVKDDAAQALPDIVLEAEHKRLGEIMADRPGRAFASLGARRSSMEYRSDTVRRREEEFAEVLNGELARRHAAKEFDQLAIVAEPRMLGHIRESLPASTQQAIVAEVAKDLTKLDADRLREAVLNLDIAGLHASR